MPSRRHFLKAGIAASAGLFGPWRGFALSAYAATPTLTRWVDPLPIPPVLAETLPNYYEIEMGEFTQSIHRDLPPTPLWGYNGMYPGPTIEARRGTPITVKWWNNLPSGHLLANAIDPTIPDPAMYPYLSSNRTVPHLHGGFTLPQYDGHPDAWFTANKLLSRSTQVGPHFLTSEYTYSNEQQATTLWYHDHAMGITRLNVYAGLAGFYLIRDTVEDGLNLPVAPYEIPIAIQDRTFNSNGTLFYPTVGSTSFHPVWNHEFFGDTPVLNGKAYPVLDVEPRRYRLRLLNGTQGRQLGISFRNSATGRDLTFHLIGTDGGFLGAPLPLTLLRFMSGERADVIMDFTGLAVGTQILLRNTVQTTGAPSITDMMQIRVSLPLSGTDTTTPANLLSLPPIVPLNTSGAPVRDMVMSENLDSATNMPAEFLLEGSHFNDALTTAPQQGAVEVWRFINLINSVHPIHLHLVQFQVLSRQAFNASAFEAAWRAGQNPDVSNYLTGNPRAPLAYENGWKDTVRAFSLEVLTLAAKFDLPAGAVDLPYGVNNPQYVFHCHILEHEDNEMMRPYEIVPGSGAPAPNDSGDATHQHKVKQPKKEKD